MWGEIKGNELTDGNLVYKKKKKRKIRNEMRTSSQILEKETNRDYQSHLKSQPSL